MDNANSDKQSPRPQWNDPAMQRCVGTSLEAHENGRPAGSRPLRGCGVTTSRRGGSTTFVSAGGFAASTAFSLRSRACGGAGPGRPGPRGPEARSGFQLRLRRRFNTIGRPAAVMRRSMTSPGTVLAREDCPKTRPGRHVAIRAAYGPRLRHLNWMILFPGSHLRIWIMQAPCSPFT